MSSVRAPLDFLSWTAGRPADRGGLGPALETMLATKALVVAWLVLPTVFLPALCLGALAASLAIAVLARPLGWSRGRGIASGEAAGGLAFLGFAAGMLSKPEQIVQLFGQTAMIN